MNELEKNLNQEENSEQEKNVQNSLSDHKQELENNQETQEEENEENLSAADKILRKLGKENITPKKVSSKQEDDTENSYENEDENEEEQDNTEELKAIYVKLDRTQLIEKFSKLLEGEEVENIREHVDFIKNYFYKRKKEEIASAKEKFVENGGNPEEFTFEDELEEQFKKLYTSYRDKKSEKQKANEEEKQKNYLEKLKVIDELKSLVNSTESLNETFSTFRAIQERWNEIGQIPQAKVKSLWETYHHHVQNFYDYVKINKELRDLDLKKNLEAKIKLCERAEELILEEKVVKAYRELQELHDRWREIGPVPKENKDEIWERFKEASGKINKRHQEYFEQLKQEQLNNLKAKTLICEEVERLSQIEMKTPKEWDETSKEIVKLQELWRAIGFAPKKDNNKIYNRFRKACDIFFERKRDYFSEHRSNLLENLEKKEDLCMQAEALKESDDWRKTTETLKKLQQKWKEIGPVPRKNSDEVWHRFRSACNYFFNRKEKHYREIEGEQQANLKLKEELLVRLEELEGQELNDEDRIKELREIQNEWSKIGFVPIAAKNDIQQKYRKLINKYYDKLDISDSKRSTMSLKNKLEEWAQHPRGKEKMRNEREKLAARIQKLRNDIALWENNIGFFAKSKNADAMIKNFEKKIENAKKTLGELIEQVKLIDGSRK